MALWTSLSILWESCYCLLLKTYHFGDQDTPNHETIKKFMMMMMMMMMMTIHFISVSGLLAGQKICFRPGMNWRPGACKAHVITTTLQKQPWHWPWHCLPFTEYLSHTKEVTLYLEVHLLEEKKWQPRHFL